MSLATPRSELTKRLDRWVSGATAQRHWRWVACVLTATSCWFAFSTSPPKPPTGDWDKLNHLLAFGSMSWAWTWSLQRGRHAALRVVLGLLLLGIFIECVQWFIPGRSSEVGDVVADMLGVLAGLCGASALRQGLSGAVARAGGRSDPRS